MCISHSWNNTVKAETAAATTTTTATTCNNDTSDISDYMQKTYHADWTDLMNIWRILKTFESSGVRDWSGRKHKRWQRDDILNPAIPLGSLEKRRQGRTLSFRCTTTKTTVAATARTTTASTAIVFVVFNHNLRYAFDWYNSLRMHTKAI